MALSAGSAVAGDYNGDGIVNAADYVVWRKTLGSTSDLRANGDNAGSSADKIDQADYNMWKSNFGRTAGSGASSMAEAVPESPSDILLWIGAALSIATWRRRDIIQSINFEWVGWNVGGRYATSANDRRIIVRCSVGFRGGRQSVQ